MAKLVGGLFLLVAASLLIAITAQAWVIDQFDVGLVLERNGSIIVSEKIVVDFGRAQRHGIFRTIPVRYQRGVQKYNFRLKVLSVVNDREQPHRYRVRREGRYLEIRIGHPDLFVSGVNTYVITYQVWRAINFFPDHDELYWNVTGNEWSVPIGEATAKVYAPEGVSLEEVRSRSFTGHLGSTTSRALEEKSSTSLAFSVKELGPGQGLTIVVGLPRGSIQEASRLQKTVWLFQDNWEFLIPLGFFLLMFSLWWQGGRNPNISQSVMVQYEPPAGLTPSEAGTLIDEKADLTDITATVVDLAARGYFKIREIKTTKYLFFSDRDYEFTRLKDFRNDVTLKEHERSVLDGIFFPDPEYVKELNKAAKGDAKLKQTLAEKASEKVLLSSLKEKFYKYLADIKENLYAQLTEAGYFHGNPEKVRIRYAGYAFVVFFLGVGLSAYQQTEGWPLLAAFFLGACIVGGFSFFMPRLTKKGAQVVLQVQGLKEFLTRVEKDRLERMARDQPLLFDRLLPYAMVLGVADEWAEAFTGLYRQPPSWFDSPSIIQGVFQPRYFVSDLGRSLQAVGSTFSSSPGGSGGSGFGGGGSSGGGGGGGGGGAW